jgi:hypothetical protein
MFFFFFFFLSTQLYVQKQVQYKLCWKYFQFFCFQDVSVFSELKRRSQLRETKKEKDKVLAAKKKSSTSTSNKPPSSASRKRLTPTETPRGQGQGSDDVDEVRQRQFSLKFVYQFLAAYMIKYFSI